MMKLDGWQRIGIVLSFGNKWRGFSHGGTLRSLVECMRDYIIVGTPIPRWMIVIQQLGQAGHDDNVWGYDVDAAQAVREAAYALPIIERATAAGDTPGRAKSVRTAFSCGL